MKPSPWITAISGNTTPTEPVALVLFNCPTKKVSAMLYSDVISMVMIVGIAMRMISPLTGAWVSLINFSSGPVVFRDPVVMFFPSSPCDFLLSEQV